MISLPNPYRPLTMTQTTDNIINRDELQDKYIQRVIDSLDLDDCLAMLYDYIDKDTDTLTLNELIEDVEEYYPELLVPTELQSQSDQE